MLYLPRCGFLKWKEPRPNKRNTHNKQEKEQFSPCNRRTDTEAARDKRRCRTKCESVSLSIFLYPSSPVLPPSPRSHLASSKMCRKKSVLSAEFRNTSSVFRIRKQTRQWGAQYTDNNTGHLVGFGCLSVLLSLYMRFRWGWDKKASLFLLNIAF